MIGEAKNAIRAGVAAITPTSRPHDGFVCIQTSTSGRQARLEDMPEGFRRFEVVVGELPVIASDGVRSCRHQAGLIIRVRYERTEDFDLFETLIFEDIIAIVQMARDATNWNQAVSGLSGVQVVEAQIENIPDDENPIAVIVGIPLQVIIRSR